eukprot:6192946-Pleurochrysis_carterae.AAC.1
MRALGRAFSANLTVGVLLAPPRGLAIQAPQTGISADPIVETENAAVAAAFWNPTFSQGDPDARRERRRRARASCQGEDGNWNWL